MALVVLAFVGAGAADIFGFEALEEGYMEGSVKSRFEDSLLGERIRRSRRRCRGDEEKSGILASLTLSALYYQRRWDGRVEYQSHVKDSCRT